MNRCSQQSEHFIGIFGCFQNKGFSEESFLAFSVLPDETDLGSDSVSVFIESTLSNYKKTRSEVKFIASDNGVGGNKSKERDRKSS